MIRTIIIGARDRAIVLALLLAAALAALIAWGWALIASMADPHSPRTHKTLIGYDQTLNAALGGHEDETISSRAYRACLLRRSWGCLLCRALDTIDPDHCGKSAGSDSLGCN